MGDNENLPDSIKYTCVYRYLSLTRSCKQFQDKISGNAARHARNLRRLESTYLSVAAVLFLASYSLKQARIQHTRQAKQRCDACSPLPSDLPYTLIAMQSI